MLTVFLTNLWQIGLDLAPSLLLGLLIAGVLHTYLPNVVLKLNLNQPDFRSVWRAALVGVPLPLCSCGVLPTALSLRQNGASLGATVAFLISTPQTGIDSILVSAAMLGMPFAIFKVITAFCSGLIGGVIVNYFDTSKPQPKIDQNVAPRSNSQLHQILNYAVFDLLGAIDFWIIIGMIIAAVITSAVPPDYLAQQTWSQGLSGMLLVLLISIPLYICATGSVPIAASLVAAGLSPSAALVFLLAGPATNVATIGSVYRILGSRVLFLYLLTVIVTSLIFGLAFDFILPKHVALTYHHLHTPNYLAVAANVLLISMLLFLNVRRLILKFKPESSLMSNQIDLQIQGMTCNHCTARVKTALDHCTGVDAVSINLTTGVARITGTDLDTDSLIAAVEAAGYTVQN
ncbi:hypothetical protein TI04_05715 [Achromatium sp. WMS2]|nr:hypothetical protein TI04_05715 [Achromatium sp. WMS2]